MASLNIRTIKVFLFHFILSNSVLAFNVEAEAKIIHPQKFFKPKVVCDSLPLQVMESSGLLFFRDLLWTFNDSGNEPCIYAMDKNGKKIVQKIYVEGAKNCDWEAICENNNYIFIGDIGNNFGSRSNLTIYRIDKDDISTTGDSWVSAKKINFTYNNYITPTKKKRSAFDAEAIVCINDTIYLFSKDWKEPYCNIYKIPTRPGHYELSVYKSVYLEGQVTDACYNVHTNTLILLGYSEYMPFLYYIQNLDFEKLDYTTMRRFNYQKLIGMQTEGATFINDSTIYMSSEYNKFRPGSLYKLQIF